MSTTVSPTPAPQPPDEDFLYLGLTKEQVSLLDGQPNYVREVVYDAALKRLMGIDTPESLVDAHFADWFVLA